MMLLFNCCIPRLLLAIIILSCISLAIEQIPKTPRIKYDYSQQVEKVHFVENIQLEPLPSHLTKRDIVPEQVVSSDDDDDSSSSDTSGDEGLVRISFEAMGNRFHLHLVPIHEFLHKDATVEIRGKTGRVETLPISARAYHGRLIADKDSEDLIAGKLESSQTNDQSLGWARLVIVADVPIGGGEPLLKRRSVLPDLTTMDLDAMFSLDGEIYHLHSVDSYRHLVKRDYQSNGRHELNSVVGESVDGAQMIMYRQSENVLPDLSHASETAGNTSSSTSGHYSFCGHDHLSFNLDQIKQSADESKLYKRAAPGCPTARKIVYMGVAADCTYVSNYRGTANSLKQILSNWNKASKLFEDNFNVQLGVIKVSLQETCGGAGLDWNRVCSTDYAISQRLSDFTKWRGGQTVEAGLWHLMTTCASGATIGVAWVDTLCFTDVTRQGNDYISGTGVSSSNPNEYIVVAHEIGHNFGAIHDCVAPLCSQNPSSCRPCDNQCDCQGQYLMHPFSDVKNPVFSPASIRDICGKGTTQRACLKDPGTRTTLEGNQCGNGIKETGEECDCGPADSDDCKNNACCDGQTCKLKPGAKCADINDLCCQNCQVKASGTPCRPSRSVCDLEERCDGNTGDCPSDSFLPDLRTCSATLKDGTKFDGQCASGDCTSRDLQCRIRGALPGITGECPGFSDQCEMYCQTSDASLCSKTNGFFLDGTACSYLGRCVNGACKTEGLNGIIGWFLAHMAIGIAILIVIVFFLAMCIISCVNRCRLRKALQRDIQAASLATPANNTPYPANLFLNRDGRNRNQRDTATRSWVDPTRYNGPIDNNSSSSSNTRRSSPRRVDRIPKSESQEMLLATRSTNESSTSLDSVAVVNNERAVRDLNKQGPLSPNKTAAQTRSRANNNGRPDSARSGNAPRPPPK